MEYLTPEPKLASPEVPAVDDSTLGLAAVETEDECAYDLLNHERQLDKYGLAERISAQKSAPESLPPIARTIGQIAGRIMTHEEAKFVADTRSWRESTPDYESLSEQRKAKVHTHLGKVRAALKNLDDKQSNRLDNYIAQNAPFVLLNMKRPKEDPVLNPSEIREASFSRSGWATWLSENASDLKLINLLQWHVYQLSEQQVSPELADVINIQKAGYKKAIDTGVSEGWLSLSAAAAKQEVDGVGVRFGDVFDTILREYGGYHFRGTGYVVVAQGVGKDRNERMRSAVSSIDHAIWHELNHAVLGKRDASPEDTTGGMRERWLDEALTEYVALKLKGADPISGPTYEIERRLLHIACTGGGRVVDMDVATRAYSGGTAEQQEFYGELNESWGANVVPMVSQYITRRERYFLDNGTSLRHAQNEAVWETLYKLGYEPRAIFGAEWVRPSKLEAVAA